MTAVVARGRRWVPGRAVAPGSFIELSEHDLEAVARAEHTRWYRRRLAAGWSAATADGSRRPAPGAGRHGTALVNSRVVPWAELPAPTARQATDYLRSQLAQLEDVGFMPVVPPGGPPGAAEFRADRRRSGPAACRPAGRGPAGPATQLHGNAGDWRVVDDGGR